MFHYDTNLITHTSSMNMSKAALKPCQTMSLGPVSRTDRSLKQNVLFCEAGEGLSPYGIANHRHAPEMEQEISLAAGQPVTELDAQAVIMRQIEAAGMSAGHPVNVSFGVNAADSHYEPSPERHATLRGGECVLIDLWAQEPGRRIRSDWRGHVLP